MSRPRTVAASDAQPRTYGGTWNGGFSRCVCEFFDRNRDEVLTLSDILIKFVVLLEAHCYAEYEANIALTRLVRRGWLAVSDEPVDGDLTYCAGPLLLELPPL